MSNGALKRQESSGDSDKGRFGVGSKSTLSDMFFLDLSDLLQIIALDTVSCKVTVKAEASWALHLLSSLQGFSRLRKETKEKASQASHAHCALSWGA